MIETQTSSIDANLPQRAIRFETDLGGGLRCLDGTPSLHIAPWQLEHAMTLGASLAEAVMPLGAGHWTVHPPVDARLDRWVDACAYASGVINLNGHYRRSRPTSDIRLEVAAPTGIDSTSMGQGHRYAKAALCAKEWVDRPRLSCSPDRWAQEIAKLATEAGMAVRIHEVRTEGESSFPAIAMVGRGSAETPKVLEMEWPASTGRSQEPPIVLCGKGVTFDSGGLGLKPQGAMRMMKADMAGAACVAAALLNLDSHVSRPRIIGLLGITENSIGPGAMAPGDVISMRDGQSVEVTDVDSEGRLILAELILYARELGAGTIIDAGTLSAVVSWCIGSLHAGIQSNSHALQQALVQAGERCGERLWHIPLPPELSGLLDGGWVDLVNLSGPDFGGVQPGLFLKHFVGSAQWAHLELSGPAWNSKWGGTVGTGFGARLLLEWTSQACQQKTGVVDD